GKTITSGALLVFFLFGMMAELTAGEAPKAFAHVSAGCIITAEVAGPLSFVVNFINLSDYIIVIQPNEFIYRGASGRFYIGQVFEDEHKDDQGLPLKYRASVLLGSRSFTGLTLVGYFFEQDSIEEISVRIGSRRFYLEPLDQYQFEIMAAKIAELDLEEADSNSALTDASLSNLGRIVRTDGTSEWNRDWQGLITFDGVTSPKAIQLVPTEPTEEALRTKTFGKVRISATITRNGGLKDLMVVKGLGHGLDERALEVVKNSWVFLPATKNGEIVQSSVKLDVQFSPPDEP
ncbi:MAG: energy transducer TonB, partial [bacterium]